MRAVYRLSLGLILAVLGLAVALSGTYRYPGPGFGSYLAVIGSMIFIGGLVLTSLHLMARHSN